MYLYPSVTNLSIHLSVSIIAIYCLFPSIFPSNYPSIHPSIHPTNHLCTHPSSIHPCTVSLSNYYLSIIHVPVSVYLSIYLLYVSMHPSIQLLIHPSIHLSIYVFVIYPSMYQSFHPNIHPSVYLYLSIHPSIHPSLYPSISLSLSLSLSASIHTYMYISIHLSICPFMYSIYHLSIVLIPSPYIQFRTLINSNSKTELESKRHSHFNCEWLTQPSLQQLSLFTRCYNMAVGICSHSNTCISEVRPWCWVMGSSSQSAFKFIPKVFRSGLCVGQSNSFPPGSVNYFFICIALCTGLLWFWAPFF